MQLLSGQFVTAGDELATRLFEDIDVFERTDFVVLTRDDLEQRTGTGNAFDQKVDQQLRGCDQGVDTGRIVRGARIVGEVLQAYPHGVIDLFARLADLRLIEQPEPQVTRDVTDDRIAHLSGNDQPVEYLAQATGSGRDFV